MLENKNTIMHSRQNFLWNICGEIASTKIVLENFLILQDKFIDLKFSNSVLNSNKYEKFDSFEGQEEEIEDKF